MASAADVARLFDDLRAGTALGHELGQQQRNDRATKTEQCRHDQQATELLRIHAQHGHDDADQCQHGKIGCQKQKNAVEHDGGNPRAPDVHMFPVVWPICAEFNPLT